MPTTTARGTDAERTEYAAPVAVENVDVDATGRLVLADRDVGLEVLEEEAILVLFPVAVVTKALVTGTSDADPDVIVAMGTSDGDTVPVPGITVGNVSVGPGASVAPTSLYKKSSENHWNSTVNSRGLRRVCGRILWQRHGSDSNREQSEELNFHYEVLEC